MSSLYEKIGGAAAVNAAVDLFYTKVLADDRIKHYFDGVDMDRQAVFNTAMADRIVVLSERPATVIEEIVVDLPDRSNPTARRQNPECTRYINRLFDLLRLQDARDIA